MSAVAERMVFVIAECLDCDWHEAGSSLRGDHGRVASLVPKHVDRHRHTVVLSRNEVRTYVPREDD
jgi:hypothetical protein